jgi:hypothetical protein
MRNRVLWFAGSVSVLTAIGLIVLYWTTGGFGSDFRVFWTAANSDNPYAPSSMPFASTPPALLLFQAFRLAPLWPCYFAFMLMTGVFFYQTARLEYGRTSALMGLFGPAGAMALGSGQVSVAVAGLVFAASTASPVASGTILAYAMCLKPQMIFLAPVYLLFDRRWTALASLSATGLMLCVLSTATFGIEIWAQWIGATQQLVAVAADRSALNMAVSPASFGVPVVICAGLAVAALFRFRKAGLPAVVGCSLFAAPYALSYDLVALAPLAAATILRGDSLRSLGAALTYTAALGPLSLLSLSAGIGGTGHSKARVPKMS